MNASSGGFYAVNARVLSCLREWLLHQARAVAAERAAQHGAAAPEARAARANLARLLQLLGHSAEAAALWGELAAAAAAAHGPRAAAALAARAAHADALAAHGELHAALRLLRAVMRDREALHAAQPEHPDVLASRVAYARTLLALCACGARRLMECRAAADAR